MRAVPAPTHGDATFAALPRFWAPPLASVAPPTPAPAVVAPEPAPAPPPAVVAPEPAPAPPPPDEDDIEALLRRPARQFEPPDLIGKVVGGYQLESFLGPTETGPVYQGRRREADGPRAVKVVIPSLTQDINFRRRFHERKDAIKALSHPNIVGIEAIGEDDGLCYVAMEWLPDGTLRNLMQRRGSAAWSLPLALDLARQAAEGLAFAHKQGFVHGSIKPNNLVLAHRSGGQTGYTLKVTDFGLTALMMEREGALDDIWGDSLIYALSPERCRGQEVDGRSDQYALGVILYELATGSVPFEAKTLDTAVFRHVYTAPVPPRAMIPELPVTLEAIILRCLAKAPADRFSDAGDLATALQDLLRSPTMAPRMALVTQPARGAGQPAGPVMPRVQALDQYGRALVTRDLTGDGLTVGSDPSNAIVFDTEAVEPRQLEMDWDGSAIIVTSVAKSSVVMVGEAALRPRESRVWQWDEPMRLGPFWLRAEAVPLSSLSATAASTGAIATAPTSAAFEPTPQPSGPAPVVISLPGAAGGAAAGARPPATGGAVALPATPAAARADTPAAVPDEQITDRIGVILDQETLTLTPGRPATFRMTLVNLGIIVDHFKVTPEGVPAAWVVGQPPQVQLNPGAKDLVTLNILAPQAPESRAGEYPVTIRARSRENPRESNIADALWTVLPFASSSFDLRPRKRVRRIFRGPYKVQLRNQGNAPATYTLSATDEEETLGYQFDSDKLTLEPGATARTDLYVRPNGIRWFGQAMQHRFSVTAKPSEQGETHNGAAQLAQPVIFPRWLLLLMLFLVLLGLAIAWILSFPRIMTMSVKPQVPVAGDAFTVSWDVTNGPIVELRVNQTPVPITTNGAILPGYLTPPALELVARNQVLGQTSHTINVSLRQPTFTPTSTPTPQPTSTPIPPTVAPTVPPPPTVPPTPTVPSPTPTITPTPTSQALCLVNGTLTLRGKGPPSTAVVAYIDGRPIGGGLTDKAGRFVILLGLFNEQPGLHPITVRVRTTRESLLFITCIVPSPTPLFTTTPTVAKATP